MEDENMIGIFMTDQWRDYLIAAFDTDEEVDAYLEREAEEDRLEGREESEYRVELVAKDLINFDLLDRGFAQMM